MLYRGIFVPVFGPATKMKIRACFSSGRTQCKSSGSNASLNRSTRCIAVSHLVFGHGTRTRTKIRARLSSVCTCCICGEADASVCIRCICSKADASLGGSIYCIAACPFCFSVRHGCRAKMKIRPCPLTGGRYGIYRQGEVLGFWT